MKAQFLKIAGVKNEQEFYKKFPTEESFFKKHGKQLQTAQNGADINGNGIPDEQEGLTRNSNDVLSKFGMGAQTFGKIPINPNYVSPVNQITPRPGTYNYNPVATSYPTQDFISKISKPTNTIPQIGAESATGSLSKAAGKSSGIFDKLGGVAGIAEGVGGIVQGFQMLEEGRKEKNKARQFDAYSQVALMASNSKDVDANNRRKYNRPEDDIITGEELFPINGVGTNVLAKNGYSIAQNGGSFFGAEDADYANYGAMGSQLYNSFTGNEMSGGSKIGGSVGKLAGTAIGGPLGGMIGEIGGNIIGGALDSTGRDTKKYQDASQRNMNAIIMGQSMQNLQKQNSSFLRNGGELSELEESGELQTLWGGEAEQISNNPYSGETVMFRGQAHNETDNNGNSGIGINYGNSPVEVERGEPATVIPNSKTGEENLVIFGNLKIPKFAHNILQDSKAHNKKFKNYVADLSKEETKLNKYIETSKNNINNLEGNTSFDKLELESNNLKLQGAMIKLKSIANKKQSLSEFQNIINDTAEKNGLLADDLAKGKITRDKTKTDSLKEAMYGYEIPKAQFGITTHKGNTTGKNKGKFASRFDLDYFNNVAKNIEFSGQGNKEFQKYLISNPEARAILLENHDKLYGKQKKIKFSEENFQKGLLDKTLYDGFVGEAWQDDRLKNIKKSASFSREPDYKNPITSSNTTTTKKEEANRPVVQYKKSPYIDFFNQVLPYLRPSNATELDGNQLLGEMYGMSSNQLEPVQSQNYRPELRTPYDISYQDQLNEITASERAAQKMSAYNPEAAAQIAAGAYQGKSKVLAEQFRANQAMKEGVYSQNTATLNDAQLKNLAFNDQQYTRQETAKSNTKAINQAILNSISSKYSQNKLENRTLGVQENMYNYRFDKSGRARNMNGLFQANVDQGIYAFDENGKATHKYVKNAKGKIIDLIPIDESTDEESTSTTETPSSKNYSFKTKEFEPLDLSMKGTDFNPNINPFTTKPFKFKNGSYISNSALVKSLK